MFKLFGKKEKQEKQENSPHREVAVESLQMDILRKMHENAGADFNLGQVGLTDKEAKAIISAIDAFDPKALSELIGSSGFTQSNLERAKLAVQYRMSCDSTLYWVISNCVAFQLGSNPGKQKETLESALIKLAEFKPENKGVYYI